LKSLSSAHVWWADSGAIWSPIFIAMGLAFHGEAAKYKENTKKISFFSYFAN
jgi:hypothetical protein